MIFLPVMESFFISRIQPAPKLLPRTVWPGLKLPLFTSLAHFTACYAHTLGYGLISVPTWNEVVRAFYLTRTSWSETHCVDGHPHSCGLFCCNKMDFSSSLPPPAYWFIIFFQNLQHFSWIYQLNSSYAY